MFATLNLADSSVVFFDNIKDLNIAVFENDLFTITDKDELNELTGPQAVALYNAIAMELNRDQVKRFADKKAATQRLWGSLYDLTDKRTADQATTERVARVEASAKNKPMKFKKVVDHSKSNKIIQAAFDGGAFDPMATAPVADKARDKAAPAKSTDTPAVKVRRTAGINLAPQKKVYPCRAETKQAILVDQLFHGASLTDLLRHLDKVGTTPWKEISVKSGLNWDMNKVKGYGIRTTFENGYERWLACDYESMGAFKLYNNDGHPDDNTPAQKAELLARNIADGFDVNDKVAVYWLVLPEGMTQPVPHTPRKKAAE